jgi:hypothetical protein
MRSPGSAVIHGITVSPVAERQIAPRIFANRRRLNDYCAGINMGVMTPGMMDNSINPAGNPYPSTRHYAGPF